MSIEPRTVTLTILVTKQLEVAEPAWCTDPHRKASFKTDITHNGPEITGALTTDRGTFHYLTAWLTQAPHSEIHPLVAIELGSGTVELDPDDVRAFTDGVRRHLNRLDALAAECERLRGEGQ
ncbi:hypothetical protein [Streptomyces sp. NPDC006997]|uniref:DUF6907 domain-containing protein n=1 Tax=Streptomyces sp. NPDC006997 TaxID=3155356 RepID=UPI0033D816E8